MKIRIGRILFIATASTAISCGDITGPETEATVRHAIVDGAHGGSSGFYFLPPLAPTAPYSGEFDEARSPAVDICLLSANACAETVATFTVGTGAEAIRMSAEDQHYIVQWHSRAANVSPGDTYRVSVRDGSLVLGFVDVKIILRASDAKTIPSGFLPLVAGATLPIKFRIEKTTLGPPVTQTVGPTGGRVDVPLGDGTVITVEVPADALNAPVEFVFTPRPNRPGVLASVGVSPSNPGFRKPVNVRITGARLPSAANAALATLAARNGGDGILLFLPTSEASGTFTASTIHFGAPAAPVSLLAQKPLAASILAADTPDEAELALVLATAAERIAAFRAAADALSERLRFEEAVWYRTQAIVLAQLVDDPQVDAALTEARGEACTALVFHQSTAEGRLGDQFSNLWNALRPVMSWNSAAEIVGVEGSECPQAAAFSTVVTGLITHFTDLYTSATEHDELEGNIPALDGQLYEAFAARRYGSLLGQEQAFDRIRREIQLPLASRYRQAAYDWCRTEHEQKYLGRLFRMARDREMYAPGLPEVAELQQVLQVPDDLGFGEDALSSDIQYCSTAVRIQTRDIDGLSSRKGVVGGGEDPGSVVSSLDVRIAPHGKLELDSVLTALVCENEQAGNDRIHLWLNGGLVKTLDRVEPTVHFIRNAPRVIDVDSIARIAGLDLTNGGTFPLTIEREGDGCAGEYAHPAGENPRTLATIQLTYPDVDISLAPASLSLQPGGTQSVVATVTGSTTGVTWEATGGTFTVSGNTLTYTAGDEPGSFSIKATSVEDTARFVSVPVEIGGCVAAMSSVAMSCEQVSVSLFPSVATVRINAQKSFAAMTSGTANTNVTWSATGGVISPSGVYTAGSLPGTYRVIAQSLTDASADTAVVYVVDNFPIVLYRRNESYTRTQGQAAIFFGGQYTFNEASRMDTLQTTGTVGISAGGTVVTNGSGSIRAMAQGTASLTTNLDVDSNLRIFGGSATGSLSATAMTEGTGTGSALADTWSVLILDFRVQTGTKLRLELTASTGGNCTTRGSAVLDYLGSTPSRVLVSGPTVNFSEDLSLAQGNNRLTVLIHCFPNTYIGNIPPTNPGTDSGTASFNVSFAFKP